MAVTMMDQEEGQSAPQTSIDEKAAASKEAAAQSGDDAVARVLTHEKTTAYVLTPEDNARVLRKLDWLLMPLMSAAVLLQFIDKVSLNYANLLGVQQDLGLHGQQYSWLGSIFYIGYLVASPVHGFFLQKLHLSRYTACIVVIWGAVLTLHAAAFNYASLVACRLFLGILEAGLTPAFILLTGRFYRRHEQVSRTSFWFSMNGWAQILGGLISYGILGRENSGSSIERWQELFLILGCITMFFGVLLFFFMPASPTSTKYLNEEETKIAIERIRENKTGINDKHFKFYQLWESLKDPRLYLFGLGVMSANISNGGVTNFGSAIISGFGFDKRQNALLGMTTGASEVIFIALGVVIARVTKTRVIPGVFCFLIAAVGGILMIALPSSNKGGRMAGLAVVYAYPVASPFYYSWLSSCIAGSSKKIVFNVWLQVFYCTGNIIGPQTYRAADAPNYLPAKATLIAMFGVSSLCLIGISLVHLWENRRRDKKGEFGENEPEDVAFLDWSDKEIRSFRYPY